MEGGAEEQRVALVAGVTGIVGVSLVQLMLCPPQGYPSWRRVHGVARRAKPAWFSHDSSCVNYIQCDLLDREHTLATLSPLSHHVTHLFFTTWTNRGSEEQNVDANSSMLRNTLDALLLGPHSSLLHVCLQTGAKHYLGSFDSIMSRPIATNFTIPTFSEDTPRLPGPNFYYAQEDILLEAAATSAASTSRPRPLTWSVHRASTILGVSPASLIQISFFLAAYACICKHDEEGLPFNFTGSPHAWDGPLDAVDSRLVAEQEIWAATHSAAHNQAFNVSNGDAIKWRDLWPAIASFFNLQAPPYSGESRSMVQMMQSKAHVWERIVLQHKLQCPIGWDHLMVAWWAFDLGIPPYTLSMAKSAQLGFVGSHFDTKASLLANFQTLQTMGMIPSHLE